MSEIPKTPDNYTESRKSEGNKKFQEALKSGQIPALKEALAKVEKEYQNDKKTILAVSKEEKADLASKLGLDGNASFGSLIKKIKGSEAPKPAAAPAPEGDKKPEPAAVPAPEGDKKPEPAAVPAPEGDKKPTTEDKKPETSMMDKVGNVVTGKLDLSTLPKEHQQIIQDLQDAGFTLKPIEGKKGEYSVDMNGLGDKSTLKITTPNQLDFKTNIIQKNGKDVEYSFQNTTQAKEQMKKMNELYNLNAELKPIEAIYETNRDHFQQAQYVKGKEKRTPLEKDLGFDSSTPVASAAAGGEKK